MYDFGSCCCWFSNKDFIECIGESCAITTNNPSKAWGSAALERRNLPVNELGQI